MTRLEDVKRGKQIQLHVTELLQNSGSRKGESYFCFSMKSRVEVGSLRLAMFMGLTVIWDPEGFQFTLSPTLWD